MKTIVSILAFFLFFQSWAQEEKRYFSDVISKSINNYNTKLEAAIRLNDRERERFLFDSLLTNHLKDTYISDLRLNKLKGKDKVLNTEDLDLPFVLITKSSWFPHDMDEVNIINEVALRFKDQIRIIMLYWGDKKSTLKLSKSFEDEVLVTYIDEVQNNHNQIVKAFKHSFGAPACFFVSSTKQLTNIDRKFSLVSENGNINSLESTNHQLALLLFKDDQMSGGVITTTDNEIDDDDSY